MYSLVRPIPNIRLVTKQSEGPSPVVNWARSCWVLGRMMESVFAEKLQTKTSSFDGATVTARGPLPTVIVLAIVWKFGDAGFAKMRWTVPWSSFDT